MKLNLFLMLTWLIPCLGYAQQFDTDLNFFVGSPQGDFRDNLDETAVGINGSIAYALAESPVQLGIELGIMTYGEDRRSESFNPDIPEVRVNVVTSYDIFTGHALLRYEVPGRIIRPYVDGLIGLQYLFTKTEVQDRNDQFDNIASDTNFDDTAFSYGVGGGVKFRVYSSPTRQAFINIKARYLLGGEAEYLQPGSIEIDDGTLTFDVSESETDILTLHLGAAFKF